MNNKKILLLSIVFSLISNCSFDNRTGIWSDSAKEKKRILDLEQSQKSTLKKEKIYSSDNTFQKEIILNKSIILSKAETNSSWKTPNFNNQNYLGNIYLPKIDSTFLKKKIGKNKFPIHGSSSPVLISKNNIIFSDDTGTIFNINELGRVKWKVNIYKKLYKRIYKNLVFSIYKENIYIADNIGLIYSISLDDGKLLWIKNSEVPIRSNIKVFKDKIFLINQDNKILCFSTKDGSLIWNILSISSFIKSQSLLSLAITKNESLIVLTSSADIYKIEINTGRIYWSRNTADSLYADATDFFRSSEIVVTEDNIIFSSGSNIFSVDVNSGETIWKQGVSSISTPIVNQENIFIVTQNGYFVILNKNTGEIISSQYLLKILKRKKQETKITGFILGSEKIYTMTLNGFLIVSSAISGKNEFFKKIGSKNTSPLTISNGKLYIRTEDSKIIILN